MLLPLGVAWSSGLGAPWLPGSCLAVVGGGLLTGSPLWAHHGIRSMVVLKGELARQLVPLVPHFPSALGLGLCGVACLVAWASIGLSVEEQCPQHGPLKYLSNRTVWGVILQQLIM